jgi:hypothetical protein
VRLPLLLAVLTMWPAAVNAQSGAADAPAQEGGVEYLSRFAFHFGAEHISHDDPRYVWDANYGGEVDFVDYGVGRATFYANYQVMLGDEFHAFDPNQGNYILGMRLSGRTHGLEVALVFHHESRHLSDRLKREPVDWNMLGARVSRAFVLRGLTVAATADVRGVVQHSLVDYDAEIDAGVDGRYPLTSRVAIIGSGNVRRVSVDGSRNRGSQTGARVEGGFRVSGRGAAVELFVAAERRVDPYPLDAGVERWVSVGFRITNP